MQAATAPGAVPDAAPFVGDSWGVDDLSVVYGKRVAVEGVSFEVRPGELLGIVGGDGAGKTTVLRVLAGAVAPTSGSVRRPDSHRIGYMSAGPGVYTDLSVHENLAFAAGAYGVRGDAFDRRERELLAATGLSDVRDRLGSKLSGGMRQKLALAAALMHKPDLLVLDEPTTGVDPVSRSELWRLFARAAAGGTAIVLATSYLDEAERAGRVIVLDNGRPLVAGTPDEVIASIPGRITESAERGDPVRSWRRGARWRNWERQSGSTDRGPATAVEGDLEDAVIIAELQRVSDHRPALEGVAGSAATAQGDRR
jgi:ABC-2 type transport system ATP-binding protein